VRTDRKIDRLEREVVDDGSPNGTSPDAEA
jgi:hypothetical protein